MPVIWPGLPTAVVRVCDVANGMIWAPFAADLAARVFLAERAWSFLARHPVDVLVVAVPMLRPLRVLRVFAAWFMRTEHPQPSAGPSVADRLRELHALHAEEVINDDECAAARVRLLAEL